MAGVVAVAAALGVTGRADVDVLGALIWLALAFGGVLPLPALLAGFGSEAVLLVAAMMAVAEGLRRAGATQRLGRWLLALAGADERRAGLVFSLAGAALAALLETTAATVALVPLIARLGARGPLRPQRLYLLAAMGAMAGGVVTLVGTSGNLVANGVLGALGLQGFSFLGLAAVGLPLAAVAALYAATAAPWLLPRPSGVGLERAIEAFRAYVTEVRVEPGSRCVGLPLQEAGLARDLGLDVLAIVRPPQRIVDPGPQERLRAGDVLVAAGGATDVAGLAAAGGSAGLEPVLEGLIPPGSPWAGATLAGLRARASGVRVLGIWRHGRTLTGRLGNVALLPGDVLLARGDRSVLAELQASGHVAWLNPVEGGGEDAGRGRAGLRLWVTLGILAAFVATAASGRLDLSVAAFAAAAALVLGGCLTPAQGYAAIQWKLLVLLAGVIPLGEAISSSGLAGSLALALHHLQPLGPRAALAGLGIAALLLTQVLSNVPATAVLTPVAVRLAADSGLSAKACVAAVLVCVLCTPLTALASKPTILIREAGGYRNSDYLRFGLPFALAALALAVLVPPLAWPR